MPELEIFYIMVDAPTSLIYRVVAESEEDATLKLANAKGESDDGSITYIESVDADPSWKEFEFIDGSEYEDSEEEETNEE